MPNVTQTMGIVTAYGAAVKGGYTGTYEEFCAEQAHFAENAQAVAQAKTDTEEYKRQAGVSAQNAATSETNASSSASNASQSASAAQGARTDAIAAKDQAVSAKNDAVTAKGAAETAQGKAEDAQAAAELSAEQLSGAVEQVETNKQDIASLKENKANVDGAYSDLTAGNAEQLVSTVYEEDSVPYIFRTAGGSMDIGDREEDMLVGGSVAWNQLVTPFSDGPENTSQGVTRQWTNGVCHVSGAFTGEYYVDIGQRTVSILAGHVYFIAFINDSSSDVFKAVLGGGRVPYTEPMSTRQAVVTKATLSGNLNIYLRVIGRTEFSVNIQSLQVIDLTQMFGTTIADYVYSLETATLGAGVAWFRKLFPANYYPYDVGTLKSVESVSGHDMVGFNQWDEEWSSPITIGTYGGNLGSVNYIPVIPNATYHFCVLGSYNVSGYGVRLAYYDSDKTLISSIVQYNNTITIPSNCHYIKFGVQSARYGNTYNHDICLNLSWDGERDGEYEPYVKHSYPLDSSLTLRGIPKLDSANNLYYDGDTYESDGTVTRRYGVVDLGTLTYGKTQSGLFSATINVANPPASSYALANILSAEYITITSAEITGPGGANPSPNMTFGMAQNKTLYINNTSYTDPAEFKTAMSGHFILCELATPTTETAEPYQNPQIVDDFGTEEYVTTSIVPVGHVTKYQPNLRAKLEMSPDSPDGDGDYIVRQANGENSYVSLASTTTIQDILARLTALEGNTNEG